MFRDMNTLIKKAFFRIVGLNPILDRWVRYRNPHEYWKKRGGQTYFEEQEAARDRTLRSEFIAGEISKLNFSSMLEVGCGYGKQLQSILKKKPIRFIGIDFSRPQLLKAKEVLSNMSPILIESDAEKLPFKDKSFDLVLSSAVILHNHHEKAKKIISEMIRVSRRYLVHNEDTDITFSRYGYDMKKTYEQLRFQIIQSEEISCAPEPSITQFTIVELPSADLRVKSEDVPLQYH